MKRGRGRRLSWSLTPTAARSFERPAVPLLLCAVSLLWLGGCNTTLSEEHCRKIADNLREAWQTESQKAAAAEGVKSDRATAVINAEGDKLVADWSSECKKELEGRRVDPKEVDCLLQARTIEQINKCSEP
jgi:hypothetical protein